MTQTTELAPRNGNAHANGGAIMEQVLILGDLAKLRPEQRASYYTAVCESVGLNPLTRPFEYIILNGRLTLYARKDATDQLRKLHKVNIVQVRPERVDDLYVVTARAQTPDGRCDEEIGAVPVGNLRGESLANAMMKATTKAKRRVTLSICGLGVLDEGEIDSIPAANPESFQEQPAESAHQVKWREAIGARGGSPEGAGKLLNGMLRRKGKMLAELKDEDWAKLIEAAAAGKYDQFLQAHKPPESEPVEGEMTEDAPDTGGASDSPPVDPIDEALQQDWEAVEKVLVNAATEHGGYSRGDAIKAIGGHLTVLGRQGSKTNLQQRRNLYHALRETRVNLSGQVAPAQGE